MKDIKVVAVDADDTLWDNQSYYDRAGDVFAAELHEYGRPDWLQDRLFETEIANMPLLGFGAKSVCISMMETGVPGALERLRSSGRYRLVLFTKGDLLDQQNKIMRSGLSRFFDSTVIVSDKGRKEYLDLCDSEGIAPAQLLMIGNSFKSDIRPVVELGGSGIHIPFHTMWKHEEAEEFDSPDIVRLEKFGDVPQVLLES